MNPNVDNWHCNMCRMCNRYDDVSCRESCRRCSTYLFSEDSYNAYPLGMISPYTANTFQKPRFVPVYGNGYSNGYSKKQIEEIRRIQMLRNKRMRQNQPKSLKTISWWNYLFGY